MVAKSKHIKLAQLV